jgi:tRNA threonylcarbamoyladenosine biosynthesis protein TsaE
MNIRVSNLAELDRVVEAVIDLINKGYRVFLLSGDLGAGKTTLVQNIAKAMEVEESVSSPTFSLVNAYESPKAGVMYHMDFYRLEKPSDLQQIGLEEYLVSGQVCFIEWPEIATDYFYTPYVQVDIEVDPNNIRNFNITTYDTVEP